MLIYPPASTSRDVLDLLMLSTRRHTFDPSNTAHLYRIALGISETPIVASSKQTRVCILATRCTSQHLYPQTECPHR